MHLNFEYIECPIGLWYKWWMYIVWFSGEYARNGILNTVWFHPIYNWSSWDNTMKENLFKQQVMAASKAGPGVMVTLLLLVERHPRLLLVLDNRARGHNVNKKFKKMEKTQQPKRKSTITQLKNSREEKKKRN